MLWVGLQIGAATKEGSMEVSQTTVNRITSQLSNCTFGNLPEENIVTNPERYRHPYVYHSMTYNSQNMAAT